MLALARESDDNGRATLTLDEISRLTRLTPRSITKCLGELTKLGELSHERGGGAFNPNSYSILLLSKVAEEPTGSEKKLPVLHPGGGEGGEEFQELASHNTATEVGSGKFQHANPEVSSSRVRGGSTPVGSTTTTKEQASSLSAHRERSTTQKGSVTVPEGAKELVTAITSAGMLVGWRLTESEWERVTALSASWGNERLVEMVARRWNADRPPLSARYLLRIWADLPSHAPAAGNVVPLRRQSSGWIPFQNTAVPSAYQNGF
ncbi:hypothetical protein [Streptomyces sp. NPDC002526]